MFGLTKESIAYCHPVILIQVKILFSLICIHGFVPDDFGIGIVVPVVKNRLGNLCISDNYRPVTLSPFVSKIFEYCVLHKFEGVF